MNTPTRTPDEQRDTALRALIDEQQDAAGQGIVQMLKRDYRGTLGGVLRLSPADQELLADAYIRYYTGIGGTAQLTTEQVVNAWGQSYSELTAAYDSR